MMSADAREASPRIMGRAFPWVGLGLSAIFWIGDASVDFVVFGDGTFYESMFAPGLSELYMRTLVCVLLTTVWATVHYARLARKAEADRRLVHDKLEGALLKLLSGHIPICAYCKSIRDENGRWTSIESYVSDRTKAQFSHGICPRCEQREFPTGSDRDVVP